MNKKSLAASGILAVFFSSLILFPSLSHALIYKWMDKKGQMHITDYYPGEENMADEPPKAVPEKPVKEVEAMAPVPSQTPLPAEEKTALPAPGEPPKQKTTPSSGHLQPQPETTPASQMPATPLTLPKAMPGFPQGQMPGMPAGAVGALISFIMSFFLVIAIVFYLFFSACLYSIAKKLNVPSPFLAWVPLVQVWTFVVAAKGTDESPVLWIIGIIIPIVSVVVVTYLWICITENMGKEKLLGLLTLVPVVNLIFIGWLATREGPPRLPDEVHFAASVE